MSGFVLGIAETGMAGLIPEPSPRYAQASHRLS